jgi:hypothetical protein
MGKRAFEVEYRAEGVELGVGMKAFAYLVPLTAVRNTRTHATGELNLVGTIRGFADDAKPPLDSLNGQGEIHLSGLDLDGSKLYNEVRAAIPVPTRGGVGSLRGTFVLADRRVKSGDTVLRIGEFPITLSGWSDFDGKLDYTIRCEKLTKAVNRIAGKLPPEALELLSDLPLDDLGSLAEVRVTGSIDAPNVKAAEGNLPLGRTPSDREKLKKVGRRFLERTLR